MSVLTVESANAMEQLGRDLAPHLEAGDVVVLHGPLGAGKTTFVRGLGEGLGIEGLIQSPTFVVYRVHSRTTPSMPPLVHVDAYRLSHPDELVDLDLDIEHSIVVVEWGRPFVEHIVDQWLDIDIQRPLDEDEDIDLITADSGRRIVTLSAHSRNASSSTRFDDVLEAFHDSRH